MLEQKERMDIVMAGHVDHGKSTLIGRLLADTHSLPEGKLEAIRALCEKNSKPFEYSFLLDALKDERSQGITIDSARCFFETEKRYYIIIDSPGHIEFLKNMITGATRAEAAILIIDAQEGIQENSRRHGFLLSVLGISQVLIVVNKMDLVQYNKERYDSIVQEYETFLNNLGVHPKQFIPVSAFLGENLVTQSTRMPWYTGDALLPCMEAIQKETARDKKDLRLPVQDIYKFTAQNDTRRIIAGTIQSGTLTVGDTLTAYPSMKETKVTSIERFSSPKLETALPDEAIGITYSPQIYLKPGEILCKREELAPLIDTLFRVRIFWMAQTPMQTGKTYTLKLATMRVNVSLEEIVHVFDTQQLTQTTGHTRVKRYEVAECILTSTKPIAFDIPDVCLETSRFVLVHNHAIVAGGTISASIHHSQNSEVHEALQGNTQFSYGTITPAQRKKHLGHEAATIVFCGKKANDYARSFEYILYTQGYTSASIIFEKQKNVTREVESLYGSQLRITIKTALSAGLICVCAVDSATLEELTHTQLGPLGLINCNESPSQESSYHCSSLDDLPRLVKDLIADNIISNIEK